MGKTKVIGKRLPMLASVAKAASSTIVCTSNKAIDECQTSHHFGGLELELGDKDGYMINRIRLTGHQGEPLFKIVM